MTLFEPNLRVERLIVLSDKRVVYDERFHSGVNIIRGENSSGKSTILNFLFYALGGDLSTWSDAARRCTRVAVEVRLNGRPATFARDIVDGAGQAMDIFGGDYEAATLAPSGEWNRYPYKRSATKESFSQAIFNVLNMPEVTAEAVGNVTLNQILRLMYADQLSPIDSIFRFEQFDPPMMRDAVGRLLCGGFDGELYANEIRIKALIKEFDEVSAELRSIISVVSRDDKSPNVDWIIAERSRISAQRERMLGIVAELEREAARAGGDRPSLEVQQQAYNTLVEHQQKFSQAQMRRDALQLEIEDASQFVADLERKLEALKDAKSTSDAFDVVRFSYCPACHSSLERDVMMHACHLCKTPYDSDRAKNRIVALINDTSLQIRQSRMLQDGRASELAELIADVEKSRSAWAAAALRFTEVQNVPTSELRGKINDAQRQIGYLDRELEDLAKKESLAALINEVAARKEKLNAEISRLRVRNERLRLQQSGRLSRSYSLIADQVRMLLHRDLPRQDAFISAKSIEFDFSANSLSVDSQTYFSASSRVVLRNSFFVGLLFAASNDAEFRHPRLCMLDSIEDKGMEQARSFNFQKQIVEESKNLKSEHQIIFCTSMIAPELDDQKHVVGRRSTRDRPTLDFSLV